MRKHEREAFDRKVLIYIRAKGTVNANEIAKQFGKKWETANASILRLVEQGKVFYHPEMGDNPCFYSIWKDPRDQPLTKRKAYAERKAKLSEEQSVSEGASDTDGDLYADIRLEWMRAEVPDQVLEQKGFVCHPSVKGSDLSQSFVRAHLHGQYLVRIVKVGRTPDTYLVPDTQITGGWTARLMKGAGNKCYYGHIKFPNDRQPYRFHSMADKDGNLTNMSVYVHPRYIYYQGNAATATIEFRRQVEDVLEILREYGWEFGEVIPKGIYSMALNNREYAEKMPVTHLESSEDGVFFDSSPGSSDKGCTEAEILCDHPTAEQEMAVMVESPRRILALESKTSQQDLRITNMDSRLDRLIDVAEKNVQLTELNMVVTMGSNHMSDHHRAEEPPVVASVSKGDVMYG